MKSKISLLFYLSTICFTSLQVSYSHIIQQKAIVYSKMMIHNNITHGIEIEMERL